MEESRAGPACQHRRHRLQGAQSRLVCLPAHLPCTKTPSFPPLPPPPARRSKCFGEERKEGIPTRFGTTLNVNLFQGFVGPACATRMHHGPSGVKCGLRFGQYTGRRPGSTTALQRAPAWKPQPFSRWPGELACHLPPIPQPHTPSTCHANRSTSVPILHPCLLLKLCICLFSPAAA
jgi:hypothetical protein